MNMKRKVTNNDIRKSIRSVINEGHGSYMAKSQLYNIARKAQSMYDQLEKGEPLEDWMESNIAKMDNMMDSVSDSFSYDQHQESLTKNWKIYFLILRAKHASKTILCS